MYYTNLNFKSYEEKESELNQKNKDSLYSNDSEEEQTHQLKPVLEKSLTSLEPSLSSKSNTFDDIVKLTSSSNLKPLDLINQKISKLDSFFSTVILL